MDHFNLPNAFRAAAKNDVPLGGTLRELQQLQAEHDRRFYQDVESWSREKQLDHCIMHLTKVVGEFARYSEQRDHGDRSHFQDITEKRLPDGLSILLKIGNLLGVDLEQALATRMSQIQLEKLQARASNEVEEGT